MQKSKQPQITSLDAIIRAFREVKGEPFNNVSVDPLVVKISSNFLDANIFTLEALQSRSDPEMVQLGIPEHMVATVRRVITDLQQSKPETQEKERTIMRGNSVSSLHSSFSNASLNRSPTENPFFLAATGQPRQSPADTEFSDSRSSEKQHSFSTMQTKSKLMSSKEKASHLAALFKSRRSSFTTKSARDHLNDLIKDSQRKSKLKNTTTVQNSIDSGCNLEHTCITAATASS